MHDLSDAEISVLRSDVAFLESEVDQPAAFLAELVYAAELQRCSAVLDDERRYQRRVANLDFVAKQVRAGHPKAIAKLTAINHLELRLAPEAPAALVLERIAKLRANLPKPRRGRPDQDSLVCMAVAVAQAFRQHLRREPSCAAASEFNQLLECVAEAADGKPRNGMHRLAEQSVRVKIVEESSGVRSYLLPRFDKMELSGTD